MSVPVGELVTYERWWYVAAVDAEGQRYPTIEEALVEARHLMLRGRKVIVSPELVVFDAL